MHLRLLFSFISLALLSSRTSAQGTQSNVLTLEVDAFINQVIADWSSPGGAAVAVVRMNDQGRWNVETKGYGIATLNGSKVTENTRFNIGSNSKLFTALAVGLLVNNEKLSPRLSWDTKIASIIPTWKLMDTIAMKQATIVDIMSHRTGMPRHDISYKLSDDIPTIIKKMGALRPSAEFRDVWQYTNAMYMLLSYIPTLLLPSKTPFARYVKQNIFDPLGMTSTTYSFDIANASGQLADGMTTQVSISGNKTRALPYWSTIGGEDGNNLSGPGGVISNAVDMATWLQTLLLGGVKPGTNDSIIPTSSIEKVASGITVAQGAASFPELSPIVYGGGQTRGTYRGHELIEHGGDAPGYHSQISRLPFDNLGVAVLTNDDINGRFIMEVIKSRILDAALGLEAVNWNDRFKTMQSSLVLPPATPRPNNKSLPAVNFTSLAGKYHSDGYGSFELCLVAPVNAAASHSCKTSMSNVSVTLPGAVDPGVPTFLAEWDSALASHVGMTHFSGNIFNITYFRSYPTGDPKEPYWTPLSPGKDAGSYAEVVVDGHHIGLAMTGIWGAGADIPSPQEKTTRERAEVWFDKL